LVHDETKVMTSVNPVLPKVATASAAFGELSADQQAEIWSRARIRRLLRGETLVLQNTPADAVFVVVSGRFEVRLDELPVPLAEIGVGQPIGEIAFFAGGLRTATVVAVRDSVVLELDRASFEDVARRVPATACRDHCPRHRQRPRRGGAHGRDRHGWARRRSARVLSSFAQRLCKFGMVPFPQSGGD
jgi:CRP-like cAMP-binding protein